MSAVLALQSLEAVARDVSDDLDADPNFSDNRDAMVMILAAIRDARADLAALYNRLELDLLNVSGEKRFVVEPLGEVEIRRSTKRTQWDNDGLTRRLVALALDERRLDETTGEYEPAWESVARVLSECARPAWRTTPLRVRGLQIDEWCHEEQDGYKVQLPPRKVET